MVNNTFKLINPGNRLPYFCRNMSRFPTILAIGVQNTISFITLRHTVLQLATDGPAIIIYIALNNKLKEVIRDCSLFARPNNQDFGLQD